VNIFRTIASGKQSFREEFVSAFLAYLLSPKMDHGLGFIFLSKLLTHIAEKNQAKPLKDLASQFKNRLWENIFDEEVNSPVVELEFKYSGGFIDIVIKCGNWFIMIENKIVQASKRENQLKEQYKGIQEVLISKGFENDYNILVIYLVPANMGIDGSAISPSFYNEIDKVSLRKQDHKAIVSWQPASFEETEVVSIVSILREILKQESEGMIAPISTEVRHALLSLIDFAMGDFQGFHYDKAASQKKSEPKCKVADVLNLSGDYFVGIQYGRGGTVWKAWGNPKFLDSEVTVTEDETRGWQYVPLKDFIILTSWCLEPDKYTLEELKWSGTPFGTEGLYLVAKFGKPVMFIGIRGGVKSLRELTSEKIRSRTVWQLSSQKKSSDWISCQEFCSILEEKGIQYP
jgi:hypothetical protein